MRLLSFILTSLVIFISCTKKIDPPQVEGVDRTSIQINSNSVSAVDSFNIQYESDWVITTDPQTVDWFELSALSGSGATKIYLTVKKINTSTTARTVTLTINPSNSEFEPASVAITQEGYTFSPWSKLLGGSQWDYLASVVATPDGGLVATGLSYSTDGDVTDNNGLSDVWVIKTDAAGNIEWEKTYGTSVYDNGRKIVATANGYAILGISGTDIGVAYIIKIAADGTLQWEKTYNVGSEADVSGIAAIPSGGFICSGTANDEALLMRIDDEGTVVWSKSYGGDLVDRLFGVDVTDDGGFIATGNTNFPRSGTGADYISQDVWVIKVDGNGNVIWEKTHGGSKIEWGYQVIATTDGGALIRSLTESDDVPGFRGKSDILLTKIDGSGNLVWHKACGTSDTDMSYDVSEIADGNFLFVAIGGGVADGDITKVIGGSDAWVVKVNGSFGNIIWQDVFGGTEADVFNGVAIGEDKVILVGSSSSTDGEFSSNHGNIDAWVKAIDLP